MQFSKIDETDQIQWGGTSAFDDIYFTFDGKNIFNFWRDYPDKLTPEQIEIFKKENPPLARLKE